MYDYYNISMGATVVVGNVIFDFTVFKSIIK